MIESFRCEETNKIWNRKFSKKFPPNIQGRARRKLIAIDISKSLNDLIPRVGIRLSKFSGVSEGYFSRLQLQYDLDLIKEKEGKEVKKIHQFNPIKHSGNAKIL